MFEACGVGLRVCRLSELGCRTIVPDSHRVGRAHVRSFEQGSGFISLCIRVWGAGRAAGFAFVLNLKVSRIKQELSA